MNWEKTQSLDFETKVSINSEGEHNEFYWSQEFPRAMEWLFSTAKKILQNCEKKKSQKINFIKFNYLKQK